MSKLKNPTSVAILMATYNGEKYLQEQIDSILSQTCRDWTLYIQDDGSSDGTLAVIGKYADNERIVLVDNGLTRQGACDNFMSLLNCVESKYYLFCDQDDVWLSDKVAMCLQRMTDVERAGTPVLVYTDKKRTDTNLNVTLESEMNRTNLPESVLLKMIKEREQLDMLRLITHIAGCVMFFNHKAKEVSFPFNNTRFHDSVVAMAVAANKGVFSYINKPSMLYRIHATNTCGVSDSPIKSKIMSFRKTLNGNMRMYQLFLLYGGKGFFHFLRLRYRLFKTRMF